MVCSTSAISIWVGEILFANTASLSVSCRTPQQNFILLYITLAGTSKIRHSCVTTALFFSTHLSDSKQYEKYFLSCNQTDQKWSCELHTLSSVLNSSFEPKWSGQEASLMMNYPTCTSQEKLCSRKPLWKKSNFHLPLALTVWHWWTWVANYAVPTLITRQIKGSTELGLLLLPGQPPQNHPS